MGHRLKGSKYTYMSSKDLSVSLFADNVINKAAPHCGTGMIILKSRPFFIMGAELTLQLSSTFFPAGD